MGKSFLFESIASAMSVVLACGILTACGQTKPAPAETENTTVEEPAAVSENAEADNTTA